MTKTNACAKSTELITVLNAHFGGKIILTRVKLISMFIIAVCKLQTVSFEKLANAYDAKVESSSSLRRHFLFLGRYFGARRFFERLIC